MIFVIWILDFLLPIIAFDKIKFKCCTKHKLRLKHKLTEPKAKSKRKEKNKPFAEISDFNIKVSWNWEEKIVFSPWLYVTGCVVLFRLQLKHWNYYGIKSTCKTSFSSPTHTWNHQNESQALILSFVHAITSNWAILAIKHWWYLFAFLFSNVMPLLFFTSISPAGKTFVRLYKKEEIEKHVELLFDDQVLNILHE